MKKICKIFIVFILFIMPNRVFGDSYTPRQNGNYGYYDYVIDSYDVDIVVNEDNSFDITETITANFNIPRHGIYRKIPLKNTIKRLDGSSSSNRVKISNLSVNNKYSTSREDNYYIIKIGDVSKTITGQNKYVIKYNYNIGKDPLKDKDEFYFNIIGNEWDTTISNITFTITMPKKFDKNKLGFSSGKYGNTNNKNVNYSVIGNVIRGSYDSVLGAKEALTIRLELEEEYFTNSGLLIDFVDMLYIVPLILLIISIYMWYKHGRDDKPIETVEFYPPEGFNSLEVGFLYKGKADKKDVTSLLVYLANLGYISISETEKKVAFSNTKDFKLRKLKEYTGNNINEKIFLNNLFVKKRTGYFKTYDENFRENQEQSTNYTEVTSDDLYNKFYRTIEAILVNINSKENKKKIFEINSINKNFILYIFIAIIFLIVSFVPFAYDQNVLSWLTLSFFIDIFIIFGISVIIASDKIRIMNAILGLIILSPVLSMVKRIIVEPIYFLGYIYGVIVVILIMYVIKIIPKRTPYGNEMLGKLKGFKNFLETAEKDKLETMVMENPNYFYDILPYTYVLGISEKWINKFETISMQAPTWYDSPSGFDSHSFNSSINKTMKSIQNAMTSSPSSTSGGSSGGGSSGGGSGGGGGGSW